MKLSERIDAKINNNKIGLSKTGLTAIAFWNEFVAKIINDSDGLEIVDALLNNTHDTDSIVHFLIQSIRDDGFEYYYGNNYSYNRNLQTFTSKTCKIILKVYNDESNTTKNTVSLTFTPNPIP